MLIRSCGIKYKFFSDNKVSRSNIENECKIGKTCGRTYEFRGQDTIKTDNGWLVRIESNISVVFRLTPPPKHKENELPQQIFRHFLQSSFLKCGK